VARGRPLLLQRKVSKARVIRLQEQSRLGQDPHEQATSSQRFKHMNCDSMPCVRWAAAGGAASLLPTCHAARRVRVRRGGCCCVAEGQDEGCRRHTPGVPHSAPGSNRAQRLRLRGGRRDSRIEAPDRPCSHN
jgi:hypothetical protein